MSLITEFTGSKLGQSILRYRGGIIVGALIGLISGGFWGLIFGGAVGGFLTRALSKFLTGGLTPQELFFKATFTVMGRMAKADGRVTESEIQFARDVMDRMGLSDERKKVAIGYFTEGKEPDFDLESVLTPLSRVIQMRADVKIMFVEIQLQAAMADGQMSQDEMLLIQRVCALLNMSGPEMSALVERMKAQYAFFQHGYESHQSGFQAANEAELLKEAYGVLGVSEQATDAEVKKSYRKLMSQHHPDKLVAKGLPEEMMSLAKEKTQEIQAAYDRIKTVRKG